MTPNEIAEYKRRWMRESGYPVRLHSDLVDKGKTWCKNNLQQHEWVLKQYTDVYEHTFWFEHKKHGKVFARKWPEYTNK